jgi:SET domain-containing protein
MAPWTEFTFILQPSALGGLGVFTTHPISKGTRLFSGTYVSRTMKIADVPAAFKKYCIFLNDEECLCPERFDRMEIGWYINHSHQPNIQKNTDKYVVAVCDIKQGEEILIDYNYLNEPEHLKEDYYKR